MILIVAYDITNDKIRNKIAGYLEKKGRRIQKSVFILDIEKYKFKRVLKDLQNLNSKGGIMHIFSLCKGCKKRAVFIGEKMQEYLIF